MLKGTELRVGNLFLGIAGIQTVKTIMDHTDRGDYSGDPALPGYEHLILVRENRNQYKPCEIDPIILTQIHIADFGFFCIHEKNRHWGIRPEKERYNYVFHIFPAFTKDNKPNGWDVCISYDERAVNYLSLPNPINLVHELQNLYFSISHKELIYKHPNYGK